MAFKTVSKLGIGRGKVLLGMYGIWSILGLGLDMDE